MCVQIGVARVRPDGRYLFQNVKRFSFCVPIASMSVVGARSGRQRHVVAYRRLYTRAFLHCKSPYLYLCNPHHVPPMPPLHRCRPIFFGGHRNIHMLMRI